MVPPWAVLGAFSTLASGGPYLSMGIGGMVGGLSSPRSVSRWAGPPLPVEQQCITANQF
jgi:hypothetical protein